MSQMATPMAPERLASLARTAVESRRYVDADSAALDAACRDALATVPEEQREAVFQEVESLLALAPAAEAAPAASTEEPPKGAVQQWMRKCAGLELQLKTEAARLADVEAGLRREQADHREATQSLALQQKQLKELQETRTRLLEDVSRTEAQLRLQITETEQAQLKYDKLKSSRGEIGDHVTEQTEKINVLEAENEQLKAQVEAALRERDRDTAGAKEKVVDAEGRTAQAAFQQLWTRMNKEVPDIFLGTHVPNTQTFERASDALVEFIRVFATLEQHVHQLLRDLRRVGAEDDKLNRFYIVLTKNPGMVETLRDYLASGKRKGNFANLLRAVQAWARAFASGVYKVIVKSPALISNELNYRSWPIKLGWGEEANIGKHFKETVHRAAPENIGTELRKQAGDMAYEDYNTLMKRQR